MNKNLLRGTIETILLDILAKEGEMYGYEICKKVKENSHEQIQLTEGALYPQLHKLEAKGILSVRHEKIGNRIRKYYSLTQDGKKQHKIAIDEYKEYFSSLNHLLNIDYGTI